jgi:putative oxidoreductase
MNALNRYADPVYCVMRFIVGLMLACHGAQLVLGQFGGMPGSNNPVTQFGGWVQLIGGLLLAFGLFTRVVAFILSGEMAVAYFMFHVGNAGTTMAKIFPISTAGPNYSNKGELAVFYSWVFFFMFFYGPGRWSVDALIGRSRASDAQSAV